LNDRKAERAKQNAILKYRIARIGLLDTSMCGWLGAKAPGQFFIHGRLSVT
jgi:hypothetical protein